MGTRRWIGLALAMALTLPLAGCGTSEPTGGDAGTAADDAAQDALVYESEHGWTFAIPASWDGQHQVSELAEEDVGRYGLALGATEFRFTPSDASANAMPLVTLITYTPEGWSEMSAQSGPPVGTQIADCGDTVVVASTPQSNPYAGTEDGERFDALYTDLDLSEAVVCAPEA